MSDDKLKLLIYATSAFCGFGALTLLTEKAWLQGIILTIFSAVCFTYGRMLSRRIEYTEQMELGAKIVAEDEAKAKRLAHSSKKRRKAQNIKDVKVDQDEATVVPDPKEQVDDCDVQDK